MPAGAIGGGVGDGAIAIGGGNGDLCWDHAVPVKHHVHPIVTIIATIAHLAIGNILL